MMRIRDLPSRTLFVDQVNTSLCMSNIIAHQSRHDSYRVKHTFQQKPTFVVNDTKSWPANVASSQITRICTFQQCEIFETSRDDIIFRHLCHKVCATTSISLYFWNVRIIFKVIVTWMNRTSHIYFSIIDREVSLKIRSHWHRTMVDWSMHWLGKHNGPNARIVVPSVFMIEFQCHCQGWIMDL